MNGFTESGEILKTGSDKPVQTPESHYCLCLFFSILVFLAFRFGGFS